MSLCLNPMLIVLNVFSAEAQHKASSTTMVLMIAVLTAHLTQESVHDETNSSICTASTELPSFPATQNYHTVSSEGPGLLNPRYGYCDRGEWKLCCW